MDTTSPYSEQFYLEQRDGSKSSAEVLVPLVIDLIRPCSVVDVGCGVGTWLSVFKQHGVANVLGIDGAYVDKGMLLIDAPEFTARDLSKEFHIGRTFDLVLSLEVAEHLPEDSVEHFVSTLTQLGSAILFSAAIPFQGGTEHKTERWPDFWAQHFVNKGYAVFDPFRKAIWDNMQVEFWYAQNILLFVRRDGLGSYPNIGRLSEVKNLARLNLVHPKQFLKAVEKREEAVRAHERTLKMYVDSRDPTKMSLGQTLALLPSLVRHAICRRLIRSRR